MKRNITIGIFVCFGIGGGAFANPYDIAIEVNDQVITAHELEQRRRLLQIFGATGNLTRLAEEQLIEDRLKKTAAQEIGISINQDQYLSGAAEFSQRGGLTTEELLELLDREGVFPESYEDFIVAGLQWREVVGARFGFRGTLSDAEVDASIALGTSNANDLELQLAEIVIGIPDRGEQGALELAGRLRQELFDGAPFNIIAAQYSDGATALDGGVVDWAPIAAVSEEIVGPLILGGVGTISQPVEVGNAIALFQLRGTRTNNANRSATIVEYMKVPLGTETTGVTAAAAADLLKDVDTCNDLRASANGLRSDLYVLVENPESRVVSADRTRIASLDLNEARVFVANDTSREIVMVCGRERGLQDDARARLRNILGSQRVESFGEAYLQELIGNATITRF
ncbi:MAG: SurA N-terminal domain-containing protein [Pseudomonadota bacterium]